MTTQESTQLWFTDAFTVDFRTVPLSPHDGQILVRNHYSLISPGTELALYTGTHVGFSDPDITWAKYPIQPGYASVGVIEALPDSGPGKIGDVVLHFSPHGSHSLLDPQTGLLFVLEPDVDPKAALFARFAQIAATARHVCHVPPVSVLVIGAGLVGNLCAQLFQENESDVVLADISETRLDLARQCGIRKRLNFAASDVRQHLQALTNDRGVDVIVEATGVPEVVTQALEIVNNYGEVLLLGSTRGPVELNVYKLIHRKKTMLSGAHESYFPVRSERGVSHETMVYSILRQLVDNALKVAPLISHEIAPRDAKRAYEGLLHDKESYLGVMINWELGL